MKAKIAVLFFGLLILWACAAAPKPRQVQNSWPIDRPFADVWRAALETLAEMNISIIEPLDKESGLINTELTNFAEDRKDCWDCGKLAFTQNKEGHRGKITVFVKKIDDTNSELKIVANFEILFTDSAHEAFTKSRIERAVQGETLFKRPCVSTGAFEAEFYGAVSEKLK
jgi:hypothetical protein